MFFMGKIGTILEIASEKVEKRIPRGQAAS
jgi:hypothetical protein